MSYSLYVVSLGFVLGLFVFYFMNYGVFSFEDCLVVGYLGIRCVLGISGVMVVFYFII